MADNFKALLLELGPNKLTREFLNKNKDWVEASTRHFDVSLNFIIQQTLLHLPAYSEYDIRSRGEIIKNDIGKKLSALSTDYMSHYRYLSVRSGIDDLTSGLSLKGRNNVYIDDCGVVTPISYDHVKSKYAKEIQESLHYIRKAREDGVLHYGLYLPDKEVPYATVSFSICKRGYQVDALNRLIGEDLKPSQVLSMTRAFAFDGAPRNSMSKLFYLSHEYIKRVFPDCRAIVTALNPYLQFSGSVFSGSSYAPYALSPMEYWYNKEGFYVPRSEGLYRQRSTTPPIVWLVHGLNPEIAVSIENLDVKDVINITSEEYGNG